MSVKHAAAMTPMASDSITPSESNSDAKWYFSVCMRCQRTKYNYLTTRDENILFELNAKFSMLTCSQLQCQHVGVYQVYYSL